MHKEILDQSSRLFGLKGIVFISIPHPCLFGEGEVHEDSIL